MFSRPKKLPFGTQGAPTTAVTTVQGATVAVERRGREVAARIGAPFVAREGSLAQLRRRADAEILYVAGRARDELRSEHGQIFVHGGMLAQRVAQGLAHPLIRAVAPDGPRRVRRIIDATLGLAGDALLLAAVLDAEIDGFEKSPALACLLEDGLRRLRVEPESLRGGAARRIHLEPGSAERGLASRDLSADVVVFDPMFDVPRRAQPNFELLRAVAETTPLSDDTFALAKAIAPRVVLKLPRGAPAPDALGCTRRERGKAIDYAVFER